MTVKIKRHFLIVLKAFLALVVISCISSCGQVGVRALSRAPHMNLPLPGRILVYDFASDKAEVNEYQGILRQQPSSNNPLGRRDEIVRSSSDAMKIELINGLRALGLRAERAKRGTTIGINDLVIDGALLRLDQGNPLRRLVIGFGSGASRVTTRVKVFHGPELRALLEFTTHADSGKLPGAVATVPAGAAIQGGMTAGVLAGGAVGTGLEAYRTEVTQMAKASGEQAVRYLSEFFAEQGWIRPDQVTKARLTY